jgi:hypothetical protein
MKTLLSCITHRRERASGPHQGGPVAAALYRRYLRGGRKWRFWAFWRARRTPQGPGFRAQHDHRRNFRLTH